MFLIKKAMRAIRRGWREPGVDWNLGEAFGGKYDVVRGLLVYPRGFRKKKNLKSEKRNPSFPEFNLIFNK